MALKVVKRKSTGAYTISGTILGRRIQLRAATNNRHLAEEQAASLEARILREQWHGPKTASRTIGEAMVSYAEAVPRSRQTFRRLARLCETIGERTPLSEINQDALTQLREKLLKPDASPATYRREVITPLAAVLNFAEKQGWLDRVPHFIIPKLPQGRTLFLVLDQVEVLIAAAVPHLRPLLIFLIGTGARMSEALELEWRDVDLESGRAIFWKTKTGRRRVAELPPRVVAVLVALPHREGRVFLSDKGRPYWSSDRNAGGQVKTGWKGALRRTGPEPELTPHDLRHTWATWHYALNKDFLALKTAGGWSSVTTVERYAHLAPGGQREAIQIFLGLSCDQGVTEAA